MALLGRAADTIYAFRFLKMLVTPFEKTKAFELGVIDDKGKVLKKAAERKTPEEKDSYTVFHKLVFNIKKLIPAGKLGSYAAALFLLKEHTNIPEERILDILQEYMNETIEINENRSYMLTDFEELIPGTFKLKTEIPHPVTGDIIGNIGDKVINEKMEAPIGRFSNINIYKVKHLKTNQEIYITEDNIER